MNKFNVGDHVYLGKKLLIVERVYWSRIKQTYYYTFYNYELFVYDYKLKKADIITLF